MPQLRAERFIFRCGAKLIATAGGITLTRKA
jgi:hypothetical protein